jgi:pimeloyl-ACP methyl ester carboxylesterase
MDLLGYGESAMPSDRSYSITEEAKFVEAFLDAKHLDRLAMAGVSMGGWIAATVALNQPQRITRLILIDSAGLSFTPDFDLALFTPRNREQIDAQMAILTPHPWRIPGFVKDDLIRRVARHAWVIKRSLASMETGADLLDQRFSSLNMPLLLVWGQQDVLTPLAIGQRMHQTAPQSVLEVYEDCGHLAVETCTDRIGPRISSFLAGTGPPAGATVEVPAAGDHRHEGSGHPLSPATPPDMRVRIGRFRGLPKTIEQPRKTERVKVGQGADHKAGLFARRQGP